MSEKTRETIKLVLLDGSTINISYPENTDYFDEPYNEMIDAIESGAYWNVGNWTEWKAEYRGFKLENINCKLVIGSH